MERARPGNWSELTRTANDLYRSGALNDALDLYDDALTLLRRSGPDVEPTPTLLMATVVSHHNRATVLVRLGRLAEADGAYAAAHEFVHAIQLDPGAPPAMRQAARCHCAVTSAEWRAFRSEHGAALAASEAAALRDHPVH